MKKNAEYLALPYTGKKGRLHYTICSWKGSINSGDLETIKRNENISGKIKFEGIGSFAHNKGYLFNTGSLLWKEDDWNFVRNHL